MRALGSQSAPKWSQVGPQGSPGVPKVPPNVQKDHLGKLPGTQVGPKVAQVPSRVPFLSGFLTDFEVHFGGILKGYIEFLFGLGMAFVAKAQ